MTAGDAGDCRKSQSRRKEGLNYGRAAKTMLMGGFIRLISDDYGNAGGDSHTGGAWKLLSGAPETQIKLIYTAVSLPAFL